VEKFDNSSSKKGANPILSNIALRNHVSNELTDREKNSTKITLTILIALAIKI